MRPDAEEQPRRKRAQTPERRTQNRQPSRKMPCRRKNPPINRKKHGETGCRRAAAPQESADGKPEVLCASCRNGRMRICAVEADAFPVKARRRSAFRFPKCVTAARQSISQKRAFAHDAALRGVGQAFPQKSETRRAAAGALKPGC